MTAATCSILYCHLFIERGEYHMIHIDEYICQLTDLLKMSFGARLVYVGLQGSYLRGEATNHSDIDIMVVVDGLSVDDLEVCRRTIESMEHADKSCGFICSRRDLMNWNPLEIGNLLNGTKDYFGVLKDLVPAFTEADIRNFIKLSINNIYHEICHRYIHAAPQINTTHLPGTYKGVFFILQNLYYLEHDVFVGSKAELLDLLDGKDKNVLERAIDLNYGAACDFRDSFELLFTWCQETLERL